MEYLSNEEKDDLDDQLKIIDAFAFHLPPEL